MRIALFTETFLPKIDGIVTVTCLLLDHLDRRGLEFMVVAPELGSEKITEYRGHPVLTIPGIKNPLYPELNFSIPTIRTYRQLKDFNPDVVHLLHPMLVGASGLAMAKWLDKPTLASFHLDLGALVDHYGMGFVNPIIWRYTQMNFNLCDFALAPSRLQQEELLARDFQNVGLWKRGVDAEKFHPRYYSEAMRNRMSDGNPQDNVLLYVGRLSNEKRIDTLKPILEALPNTRLALVGDGPQRKDLEAHFAGTNTVFMGYLKGDELAQAFASADVFTFPSAKETFGLVIVEAMASGLPVVTTMVGGAKDVIQPGVTGYAYPVGDVDGFVDGVRQIVSSRENIQRMGQAARSFAETQTWEMMMDEVIDHYHQLQSGRIPAVVS
jgi:glycosyltransferase involved in cell wall biosynthesis